MAIVWGLPLQVNGINWGQRWKADDIKLKGMHETDGFDIT